MSTRIENVPKLRTVPAIITAPLYNLVHLALIRLDSPLRLRLPAHRNIDVVLSRHTWVCLDRTMYDLPALAWTNLNRDRPHLLHAPIECQLNYYHIHANISANKVLDSLYIVLEEMLADPDLSQPGQVIRFPHPE